MGLHGDYKKCLTKVNHDNAPPATVNMMVMVTTFALQLQSTRGGSLNVPLKGYRLGQTKKLEFSAQTTSRLVGESGHKLGMAVIKPING